MVSCCINGKRILVHGVNIHEHHPVTGHYQTMDMMMLDIKNDETAQCQCGVVVIIPRILNG